MQEEPDDAIAVDLSGAPDRAQPPGAAAARGVWALLVGVALVLGLLLLQAGRVVAGAAEPFGPGQEIPLHDRLALLALSTSPDLRLLLPLAGLGAVAWLTRHTSTSGAPSSGAARRVAVALAALLAASAGVLTAVLVYLLLSPLPSEDAGFFGQQNVVDNFALPCADAALLTCLSVLLVAVLRHREPVARLAAAPPSSDDAPDPVPAVRGVPPEPVREVEDPHARFRPPSAGRGGSEP